MKKQAVFLIVAALTVLAVTTQAQTPAPTLTVYLEQWSRYYSQNLICISPNCSGPNSTLPERKTVESNYERFSPVSFNKDRTTVNTSSPAYHTTTTIEEQFVTTGTSSAGFTTITSNDGTTTTVTQYPITGINDLGEAMTYGSLRGSFTNAQNTVVEQRNMSDVSQTILEVSGGQTGWVYTYRLPYQVVEKTWNTNGQLVTVGDACAQATFPAFPQGVKSGCNLLFNVNGGPGTQEVDITPAGPRYFEYSFGAPVLIRAVKVNAE